MALLARSAASKDAGLLAENMRENRAAKYVCAGQRHVGGYL